MVVRCDDCGPLGYDASDLLRPAYWFFDLPQKQCPTLPEDHSYVINGTVTNNGCRIYFNLCKAQLYQCSGAVCARYNGYLDLVTLLGDYKPESHPFHEKTNIRGFNAIYTGEKLMCGIAPKTVKTTMSFTCDKNAIWNFTNTNFHGGSIVHPSLIKNATFDNKTCEFKVMFLSSEACPYYGPNDSQTKPLSYGSLILILVLPGLVLYFILGALFNRMRGFHGKDMIPHRTFWADFPELVMDGFIFTMATVTCKKEDRYSREYTEVE